MIRLSGETNDILVNGVSVATEPEVDSKVLADRVSAGQRKNYIINGDMAIDQWNGGGVIAVTGAGTMALDRFQTVASQAGKITAQQRVSAGVSMGSAPFEKCLQIITTVGYPTLGATEQFVVSTKIEGTECACLQYGGTKAKTTTLSFWVKSNVIGTYPVAFRNSDVTRSYVTTYTINVANTFEYKTITIPGDTTGTWLRDTGIGLRINFNLATGSSTTTSTANTWIAGSFSSVTGCVNAIATTGNDFYITGVKLEDGTVATEGWHPYDGIFGGEVQACEKYLRKVSVSAFASLAINVIPINPPMRITPTISSLTFSTGSGGNYIGGGVNYIYQSTGNSINAVATMLLSAEL